VQPGWWVARGSDGHDRGRDRVVTEGTHHRTQDGALSHRSGVSSRHLSVELPRSRVRVNDLESKKDTRYLGARSKRLEGPIGAQRGGLVARFAHDARARQRLASTLREIGGLIGRAPRCAAF